MTITIGRRNVTVFLSVIVLLLMFAHVTGMVLTHYFEYRDRFELVRLFNFGREQNIPTLFSSVILLICSYLLFLIYFETKSKKVEFTIHWLLLALVFGFLAVDESAVIHEELIVPIRRLLPEFDFLYFAWILPYGIALILLSIFYIKFLLSLSKKVRILFIASATVYISGAIGLEMIGGYRFSIMDLGNKPKHLPDDMIYALCEFFEESLEMIGTVIFINALLLHIGTSFNSLHLRFSSEPERSLPLMISPVFKRIPSGRPMKDLSESSAQENPDRSHPVPLGSPHPQPPSSDH